MNLRKAVNTCFLVSAFGWPAFAVGVAYPNNDPAVQISKAEFQDRVKAVWTAQIISVVLGWQFEHQQASVIWVDQYPKSRIDQLSNNKGAPLDDDWYYEMAALRAFQKHGVDLTIEQLGHQWVLNKVGTWGSSEMARLNLENGVSARKSGHPEYNRLWFTMGNQCRGELFGLLAPGNPNLAARLSSDLGHINSYAEGTDGGVMVSVMISLAFIEKDPRALVRRAVGILDPSTAHRQCIDKIIQWAESGLTHKEICNRIEDEWHFVYPATNNAVANMGLAVAALWFGEGDFLKTINLAYSAADFTDADCNAAIAGSVVAAMRGTAALPEHLVQPLNNCIIGTHLGPLKVEPPVNITIDELARQTVEMTEKFLLRHNYASVHDTYYKFSLSPIEARPAELFHPDEFVKYWNPSWTLERSGFGAPGGGHRGIRGGTFLDGDVLATFPRDEVRGVVIRRTVMIRAGDSLHVEVGADPGRTWKLEILVDNTKHVSQLIDGGPSIGWSGIAPQNFPPPTEEYIKSARLRRWTNISLDLTPYAGQSVTIRLYQHTLVRNKYPGNAYWRNLKIKSYGQ